MGRFARPTWVEIDLNKLKKNFHRIKRIVGKRKIIGAVKADAYGHGAVEVSKILEKEGIYALSVASFEEALKLRENGIKASILVLGYVVPSALPVAAKFSIPVTLFDKRFIKRLGEYRGDRVLNIHINVDTGMGRIGVAPEEVPEIIDALSVLPNVALQGIYTHLSTVDSDTCYANEQLNVFEKILDKIKKKGVLPPIIHAANSAAILNLKRSYFNAVRPGLLLYGLTPLDEPIKQFEPIMNFKTRAIYSRLVPKGTAISYGRAYITTKETLIATLPVGYADGYSRSLSNIGEVLIKKRRARIIGNITMDQMMIDVTDFPYIHPGNEVVLIGKQGEEVITPYEIAKKINTINYEIVSRIGGRIPRTFIYNSHVKKY